MSFNIDWYSTIADLCGIEPPKTLEGKSLVPVIKNNSLKSAHKEFYWNYAGSWAIRKNEWKLIGNPKDTSKKGELDPIADKLFLVNLSVDSTEMTNLATKYPNKVKELLNEYNQWEYSDN